jgi:hypothetical protein
VFCGPDGSIDNDDVVRGTKGGPDGTFTLIASKSLRESKKTIAQGVNLQGSVCVSTNELLKLTHQPTAATS